MGKLSAELFGSDKYDIPLFLKTLQWIILVIIHRRLEDLSCVK